MSLIFRMTGAPCFELAIPHGIGAGHAKQIYLLSVRIGNTQGYYQTKSRLLHLSAMVELLNKLILLV